MAILCNQLIPKRTFVDVCFLGNIDLFKEQNVSLTKIQLIDIYIRKQPSYGGNEQKF